MQVPDGEVLAGRAAKTGPNLFGVVGRTAGMVEDFRYSDLMTEAGEMGMTYDEPTFVSYVTDPTSHLRDFTGDTSGRGKMTDKVRKEGDAADLYAFIAQFAGDQR